MGRPICRAVGKLMVGAWGLACLSLTGFAAAEHAGPGQPGTAQSRPADAPDPQREELIRRLQGQPGGEGVFSRVLSNMQRSHWQLSGQLDPGLKTQELQARIVADLDEAIVAARKMQSSGRRTGQTADLRQAGRRRGQAGQGPAGQADAGDRPGEEAAGRPQATERPLGGRFSDPGRGWGHLPDRDREAVIQSLHDRFLRKYDELIRRYYEALAETDREP